MNNLKKVGLTALAGSLALTAAHAGEMSVSGSMVATYNKRDTKESTGNPFGMKTNLTFSGSSELDNGMTASMFTTSSDKFAGQFSGKISLDMGDAGTIALDQASGGGAYMVDDKMPTAYEESWDNLDSAYTAGKMDYTHTGGINYTNSFSDVAVDLLYRKGGGASNADGGTATAGASGGNVKSFNLQTSALMDGLSLGMGYQTVDTFADGGSNLCIHFTGQSPLSQTNLFIIINSTSTLKITEGRHPVIEQQLPIGEAYVPNNIFPVSYTHLTLPTNREV